MSKIAFVFPGQGSQFVGMGKELYESSSNAKRIFDTFDEIAGRSLTKICFEGPEEELKLTSNTQPAILAVSIAALEALREKSNIQPVYLAGHSLGEYAALYAAGVLSMDNVLKMVSKRAELMHGAKSGAMAAILGLEESKLHEVLKEASSVGVVTIANYNTPEQLVITGEPDAVTKANELALAAGAKRAVPLAVSGAFHSPLMKEVSVDFAEFIKDFEISDASIPVITNVDAKETKAKECFLEKMPEQIYSSVLWTQTIGHMLAQGVDTIVEIGPGKVLSGMNRKISRDIKSYNIQDMQSLEATLAALA